MSGTAALRRVGRLILLGLAVWAITFLGVVAAQFLWPKGGPAPARADAIVCLGAGMSFEGWTKPDDATARRAEACVELYREGAAPVVVFTGYGHEILTVAEAMAVIAREAGVPEGAMLVEPRALSTIQNAAFSLEMLGETPERLILVSDAFHLPRSWAIFRVLGVGDVALYSASGDVSPGRGERSVLDWLIRESLAIWANMARLAAYAAGGLAGVDHATRIAWFN